MPELPSGTVTFLFTDIEGSTIRWEHEPEAMAAALDRHDALLRASIQEHHGSIVKTVGDAFLAAFARAPDAVAAVLDAQRRLQAESWAKIGALPVRMALHTGVAEERDGDYFGPTLNRAARLSSIGHGGQILLSQATYELVRDASPPGTSLVDLGAHRLKDVIRPERVYQLTAPDLPSDFPPLTSIDTRPHNLPIQPTALLGREHEVADVRALLRQGARLLTLTGPGGSGKTRLALQVGAEVLDDFVDGVFLVELAPIVDPALVPSAVSQALGIRDVLGDRTRDSLVEHLRNRSVLLILDNFEQILAAAPLVADLLATSPGLKILVTSRETLRVRGEREYAVPPLSLPAVGHRPSPETVERSAAVDLFVERAVAIRSDFALTEETVPLIAEICTRLDGLPLAIELAAARVRLLTPQAMVSRMERRLPLLTGGARDLPARQQTLRGAIAWSHDLLDAPEQRLFRRLAVFVGGWTLEAAEAICDPGDLGIDVLDGLDSLIAKNLVKPLDSQAGEPRFGMLETIREYGLEQLGLFGEEPILRRRHLQWFSDLAEAGQIGMHRPDGDAWTDRLASEHDNLRAALAWSLADADPASGHRGLVMAGALLQFWLFRDHLSEGRNWLEQILAADQERRATDEPTLHGGAPLPAVRTGALGAHPRVIALNTLTWFDAQLGRFEQSTDRVQEALVLARTVDDQLGEAHALTRVGQALRERGDPQQALQVAEQAMAIFLRVGESFGLWRGYNYLGSSLNAVGEYDRARQTHEQALAIARSMGHPWGVGQSLHQLAMTSLRQGDLERARALFEESLSWWTRMGDPRQTQDNLWLLGRIALEQGEPSRAAERFRECLASSRETSERHRLARCLEGLAAAALTSPGDARALAVRATRLLGAAAGLRELSTVPMSRDEQVVLRQAVTVAQDRLGGDAYASALAEGRAMGADRAVAYALSKQDQG